MSILPFDVKVAALLDDPIKGIKGMHPESRAMLEWICALCLRRSWARPVVTCVGRTKDDQEELYATQYTQELRHQGWNPKDADSQGRDMARRRFSWHCMSTDEKASRAFDLRDWIYTDDARHRLVAAVKDAFPKAEVLDHAIPGGVRHLHFAIPNPAGKPLDWL